MKTRQELVAEFSSLSARSAELRAAGDTDALIANTAAIASIVEEIRALDASTEPVVISAAAETVTVRTLGQEIAAAGSETRRIGGTVELSERDLFTGPTVADHAAGIKAGASFPTSFIDLLPVVPTNSASVEYFEETGFTNAASAKAAGQPFDKSGITYDLKTTPVARIGHYWVNGVDVLNDVDGLAARINSNGVRGLREAVETQAFSLTHTANGIKSVIADAAEVSYEGTSTEAKVAAIRGAIEKVEAVGRDADVIVVTPAVRAELDLMSAPANGGNGLWVTGMNTLFGVRIVTSRRLPEGVTALVGSTSAATLRPRTGIEVSFSDSAEGVFLKDGVVTKVRQRLALEIERPDAFVVVKPAVA